MELLVKGKNLEVVEAVQGYIRRKISRLERHLPKIGEVKVELSQEMTKSAESRYVVQVTINSDGAPLRAEERATTIYAAIDAVVDALSRQIERFKGKLYRSRRRALPSRKGLGIEQEEARKIVKVKRFPVKPMSPEEAAGQMELLGHDFFIFFNAESVQLNVLYRRSDGNYGVIEPELA